MTNQTHYSPEHWRMLMDAPEMIVVATAILDGGVIAFSRKLVALYRFADEAKSYYAGNDEYPANELILAALDEIPDEDTIQKSKFLDASQYNMLVYLQELQKLALILNASSEHIEYRQFLVTLSERIASASGGGLFGSGKKFSKEEQQFVEQLKSILGLT